MTADVSSKKFMPTIRLILLTALITLLLAGSSAYFLGYLGSRHSSHSLPGKMEGTTERKIAYWRSPMNPTEIYDKPGKSAMGMDLVPVYENEAEESQAMKGPERKIAYWRAPMNPTEIYDKPGKSAMGMDLVPVYEDALVGGVEVVIDPVTQQNMGLRKAIVEKKPLTHTIRTYGHVTSDETRTAQISSKVGGWIEKLYVDITGMYVEKGEPLFDIFSPELLAAQEEFLATIGSLKHQQGRGSSDFLASSRRRLQYFDISESEIQIIEKTGEVKKTLMIRSPGTMIYRISDLSKVWVEAHIYEYELPWVTQGLEAEMSLPYQPGKMFSGTVSYVYPYLQPKTRDVVVRLEFDNPDLLLKPDMYANVRINTATGREGLVIPSEAVIRSGERNVVFVTRDENKFVPRNVTLGLSLDNGMVQVLEGLAPGETIVTSGQFLIDSESNLKEAVQKMLEIKRAKSKAKMEDMKEPIKEVDEDVLEDTETE
jgi:Cu(I)/Ag(I) efflux system membrane fusion protein/cobalt-zinc-cadmium efflux system membrane fusion protein